MRCVSNGRLSHPACLLRGLEEDCSACMQDQRTHGHHEKKGTETRPPCKEGGGNTATMQRSGFKRGHHAKEGETKPLCEGDHTKEGVVGER